MKNLSLYAGIIFLGLTGTGFAQSLPQATYTITGTVLSNPGRFCPFSHGQTIAGIMIYPGAGNANDNLLIDLQAVTAGEKIDLVALSAFPPPPSSGLNGWSPTSPVSPNYAQYRNGKLVSGGVAARVGFDLAGFGGGGLATAQGKITMKVDAIYPCTMTLLVTLQQSAPY